MHACSCCRRSRLQRSCCAPCTLRAVPASLCSQCPGGTCQCGWSCGQAAHQAWPACPLPPAGLNNVSYNTIHCAVRLTYSCQALRWLRRKSTSQVLMAYQKPHTMPWSTCHTRAHRPMHVLAARCITMQAYACALVLTPVQSAATCHSLSKRRTLKPTQERQGPPALRARVYGATHSAEAPRCSERRHQQRQQRQHAARSAARCGAEAAAARTLEAFLTRASRT